MAGPVRERGMILVLGPVVVRPPGGGLPVTALLERALVGCLALRAGRAVPMDALVDGLWEEDEQPAVAEKAIQVLVSRVRRAFGDRPGESPIRTVPGGYLLDPDLVRIDALEFEAGLAAARRAAAEGDPGAAAVTLDAVLDLWRGPAFMDARDRPFAVGEAARLDGLRIDATLELAEVLLGIGRAAEAVPLLERLAAGLPLDERAAELLMRSLFAEGRQAEALATYHRVRDALAEDLGVDPGEALERTQQRILSQDESLAPTVARSVFAAVPPSSPGGPRALRVTLPAPIGPMVGRVAEVEAVAAAVTGGRLVTLTGPGGVGKTRLAIVAAARASPSFDLGAAFVDLSIVREPSLAPEAIVDGLRVPRDPAQTAEDAIVAALESASLLLVLDNFEQVLGAAPSVANLLNRCPGVHVLTTSRAPLGLRGEREIPVSPLALPAAGPPSAQAVGGSDAVRLFVQEVNLHSVLELTDGNAGSIAEICRRLDGLPLALELVAAGSRATTLPAILEQLAGRLDIIAPQVDMPQRQRSLRAAIAWSAGMLSDDGRELLARLGVFAGGFTADAAAAVVGPGANAGGALRELVRHSLVRRPLAATPEPETGAEPRFAMLDTVRDFALDALALDGGLETTRIRQVEWLGGVVEQARMALSRAQSPGRWRRRLDAERANVRDALAWAAGTGRDEPAMRLVVADELWLLRGAAREGLGWVEDLLARPTTYPTVLAARARMVAARLAFKTGDLARARTHWEAAAPAWQALGERRERALVENFLGIIAEKGDDLELARQHGEQALALMRAEGDDLGVMVALGNLGVLAMRTGDLDAAEASQREILGHVRPGPESDVLSTALTNLADIEVRRGRPDRARPIIAEAIEVCARLADAEGLIICLETTAGLAAGEGRADVALRLLGAAAQWRLEATLVRSPHEEREAMALLERARADASTATSDVAWAQGLAMTATAAVDLARSTARSGA